MKKPAEITARLRRLFSGLGQKAPTEVAESPHKRQEREQLFRCAVQLLDDAAAAEQVVQQALRQAEQGRAELAVGVPGRQGSPERSMADGWLLRQVVSLSVQRLKALSILPVLPPIPEAARGEREPEAASRPEGSARESGAVSISETQRRERTARALLKLPVEMRVTLILVLMQGRTTKDVAALLGSSETTCEFWLSHGRKQLRRALQRDLAPGTETGGLLRVVVSPETPYDLRGNKKAIARA
ncbi:MAG: hypothetical protein KAY55_03450 [Deltaproteobacteria bacterium]|nr:hypothetical protein [Deltaproteobacteria bacterium]